MMGLPGGASGARRTQAVGKGNKSKSVPPVLRKVSLYPWAVALIALGFAAARMGTKPALFIHRDDGRVSLGEGGPQYAAVIDAGSSGSRLFIYTIEEGEGGLRVHSLPGMKVTPGLSEFSGREGELGAYLRPLFEEAATSIPEDHHSSTLVYLKGTAGMRLLTPKQQDQVYSATYQALAEWEDFPFRVQKDWIGGIDGNDEAFYAVLSTNYLEGRIDVFLKPTGHESGVLGALDMGGASTQIIFDPLHLGGKEEEGEEEEGGQSIKKEDDRIRADDFWANSYLSYGVAEVRQRAWESLAPIGGKGGVVANPCTFKGHEDELNGWKLVGTGDSEACAELMRQVLWGEMHEACSAEGLFTEGNVCAIDDVQMPAVRGDFYAVSVWYYAMDCVRHHAPTSLENWPRPNLVEIKHAVEEFCSMDWHAFDEFLDHPHTAPHDLAFRCMEGVYLVTLLAEGYGFSPEGRNITYALRAGEPAMELEWTLGYFLAEVVGDENTLTMEWESPNEGEEEGEELETVSANVFASWYGGVSSSPTLAVSDSHMLILSTVGLPLLCILWYLTASSTKVPPQAAVEPKL